MSYNKLLRDIDRERYENDGMKQLFWQTVPDVMARKFPNANVQQYFVYETVKELAKNFERPTLLSVGCYEDTAYEVLKRELDVVGIDPVVNYGLEEFISANEQSRFDIVFSTSVIEHVEDDNKFLNQICSLLNPGSYGVLTMDFKEGYTPGDRVPYTDVRFYTKHDLMVRFQSIINSWGCSLIDSADWSGEPDFEYDGCQYSFATFVFRCDAWIANEKQ